MRVNEPQLLHLAAKAKHSCSKSGYVFKKAGKRTSADSPGIKWHRRWCVISHNLMFYFECKETIKPQGMIVLEDVSCDHYPYQDKTLVRVQLLSFYCTFLMFDAFWQYDLFWTIRGLLVYVSVTGLTLDSLECGLYFSGNKLDSIDCNRTWLLSLSVYFSQ